MEPTRSRVIVIDNGSDDSDGDGWGRVVVIDLA